MTENTGEQHTAIAVLYVLVNNAMKHALTPGAAAQGPDVWLRIAVAGELLIDVTDPDPAFPDFDRAVAGELGRGLWGAKRLGAAITWFPADGGKTVRATMRPGLVPARRSLSPLRFGRSPSPLLRPASRSGRLRSTRTP
ncbi:ATP-binding protein [Streptomyces sp. NPDC056231]|uniref:ATP-binding protein n=1 Tax=Streptomyces sp. NPDC056231 TaxID=3345755 RepID=UPI003AAC5CA8